MEAIRLTPAEADTISVEDVSQTSASKKPDSPRTRRRKRRRKNYVDPAAVTYIPADYIKTLQSSAVMMSTPQKAARERGVCVAPDEQHQIRHAVLRGQQLN